MRLVCPNCDATYEVPDSVIPPEGRDVQCSNCGTAWFFNPSQPVPADPVVSDPEPAETEREDIAAAEVPPPADDVPVPEPEVTPDPQPDVEVAETPPPLPPRPRRPLDESVVDVLREEAAFEARARAEDVGMEYQDDLPLMEPPASPPPEPDREIIATVAGSRRDLLPDIDEINSTLRATSERKAAGTTSPHKLTQAKRQRQGFRLGMGLAALVLAFFTFAYTLSDWLTDAVPALAPLVDGYVAQVNGGRLWLEDAVNSLVERMGA
ncbi:MAG: zinc-ribbon domain-containing protein [Pseudomonadota bacterium]